MVGITISPNNTFSINAGETKQVTIELRPEKKILETPGTFNFVYKIKGEKTGIQEDTIAIRIINLKEAVEINSYNIALGADKTKVYVKNKVSQNFQLLGCFIINIPVLKEVEVVDKCKNEYNYEYCQQELSFKFHELLN